MKRANIKRLENKIIKTRNAELIYEFARYVKGADAKRLEDDIAETGNAEQIYEFTENLICLKN